MSVSVLVSLPRITANVTETTPPAIIEESPMRYVPSLGQTISVIGVLLWFTIFQLRIAANAEEMAAKPNIVLILADDLGDRSLSCFGGTVPTPNLDSLAREGMVFENAHAAPMCAPTRDEMFTGKSRARFAGRPGLESRFFTNLLQQQGYRTGMAGKWFVGSVFDPPRRGFDEACVMVNGYRHWAPDIMVFGSQGLFDELNQPDVEGRLNEWEIPLEGEVRHKATCLPEQHSEDVQVDFLCDFIERQQDKPFFAYYSSKLAHVPQTPTPDTNVAGVIDIYRRVFARNHGRDLSKLQPQIDAEMRQRGISAPELREYRKDAIAYLDKSVGRLLQHIDRFGLRENTMVVFLSDNGNSAIDPLPDGARRTPGRKGDSRDGGTRVPLLVRWPQQIAPGSRCRDLVHVQDFLPTFVELAGGKLDNDAEHDGRSFAPQLLGKDGDPRTYFVGSGAHPSVWLDRVQAEVGKPELESWKMVWVHGIRYKLYDDGRFYDLEVDLEESNSIPVAQAPSKRKRFVRSFRRSSNSTSRTERSPRDSIVSPCNLR